MNYQEFLAGKKRSHLPSGFDVAKLNDGLFECQKFVTKRALHHGKYAVFSATVS